MTNIKQIREWVKNYEKRLERGDFDKLTKFRKREWEAAYCLAIKQLERENNHGA